MVRLGKLEDVWRFGQGTIPGGLWRRSTLECFLRLIAVVGSIEAPMPGAHVKSWWCGA